MFKTDKTVRAHRVSQIHHLMMAVCHPELATVGVKAATAAHDEFRRSLCPVGGGRPGKQVRETRWCVRGEVDEVCWPT